MRFPPKARGALLILAVFLAQGAVIWGLIYLIGLVATRRVSGSDVALLLFMLSTLWNFAHLYRRVQKLEREGKVTAAARDALASFQVAGFSEEQAKHLLREAMTAAVRERGGWQP